MYMSVSTAKMKPTFNPELPEARAMVEEMVAAAKTVEGMHQVFTSYDPSNRTFYGIFIYDSPEVPRRLAENEYWKHHIRTKPNWSESGPVTVRMKVSGMFKPNGEAGCIL